MRALSGVWGRSVVRFLVTIWLWAPENASARLFSWLAGRTSGRCGRCANRALATWLLILRLKTPTAIERQ